MFPADTGLFLTDDATRDEKIFPSRFSSKTPQFQRDNFISGQILELSGSAVFCCSGAGGQPAD